MNTTRTGRLHFALAALLLTGAGLPAQLTEWPATVAPGRFLLEMDAISLTIDREGGDKYTAFGAASTFLTVGVAQNWDIQIGAELFISQKADRGGLSDRNSGIGDVYFRTKWRFYENTEMGASAAVIPFVKIPTNSGGVGNDSVEGGVIVPWQATLAGGLVMYSMVELDLLRNDADDGYDTYWFGSMALSREVTSRIRLYAELAGAKSSGGSPWEATLGGGVTFNISENIWWDFAVYRGLSRGAADWNPVVRFNWGF